MSAKTTACMPANLFCSGGNREQVGAGPYFNRSMKPIAQSHSETLVLSSSDSSNHFASHGFCKALWLLLY